MSNTHKIKKILTGLEISKVEVWHTGKYLGLSMYLTHLPQCISESVSIGSDNGLSPIRRWAIFWSNAGLPSNGPLGTNFSGILIKSLVCEMAAICPGEDELRMPWSYLNQYEQSHHDHLKWNSINRIQHKKMLGQKKTITAQAICRHRKVCLFQLLVNYIGVKGWWFNERTVFSIDFYSLLNSSQGFNALWCFNLLFLRKLFEFIDTQCKVWQEFCSDWRILLTVILVDDMQM